MQLVQELERRLMPALDLACGQLREEVPGKEFEARSDTNGAGKWHVLSLVCYVRPGSLLERVGLQVDMLSLDGEPSVQALVWWEPVFVYECQLFPRPAPASSAALQAIERYWPDLLAVFKEAAERGQPRPQHRILSTESF